MIIEELSLCIQSKYEVLIHIGQDIHFLNDIRLLHVKAILRFVDQHCNKISAYSHQCYTKLKYDLLIGLRHILWNLQIIPPLSFIVHLSHIRVIYIKEGVISAIKVLLAIILVIFFVLFSKLLQKHLAFPAQRKHMLIRYGQEQFKYFQSCLIYLGHEWKRNYKSGNENNNYYDEDY